MNDPQKPDPQNEPARPPEASNQPEALVGSAKYATNNVTNSPATQPPGWERATLEKLAFASLNEQKARRRWKTFVWLAWLAFFVFLAWTALGRTGVSKDVTSPHTAVVEIKGEIASGAEASADLINASMRAAFEDAGAKAWCC